MKFQHALGKEVGFPAWSESGGRGSESGEGSASRQRESASKGDGVYMQGEGGLHSGGAMEVVCIGRGHTPS